MGCHFLLQEIFLTQGSKLGLPHCRQTLYQNLWCGFDSTPLPQDICIFISYQPCNMALCYNHNHVLPFSWVFTRFAFSLPQSHLYHLPNFSISAQIMLSQGWRPWILPLPPQPPHIASIRLGAGSLLYLHCLAFCRHFIYSADIIGCPLFVRHPSKWRHAKEHGWKSESLTVTTSRNCKTRAVHQVWRGKEGSFPHETC